MGDDPPVQGHYEFNDIYNAGNASPPLLDNTGRGLADALAEAYPDLFEDLAFEQGPVKKWDRTLAKIVDGQELNPALASSEIKDVVRGRLVLDTPEQIRAVQEFLSEEDNRLRFGIETPPKDRFAKPSATHYRDINITVRLENGHLAEIQVNQRDLLAASEYTHDSYEEIANLNRTLDLENRDATPAEELRRTQLLDYTRDVHNHGASKVPGLDDLLSDAGQEKLEQHFNERLARDPDFVPGQTLYDDPKYGAMIPYLSEAEAYGGDGYKPRAKSLGISVEKLDLRQFDTSAFEDQRVFWEKLNGDDPGRIIVTDTDYFNDLLSRQGLSPDRYAELGVEIETRPPALQAAIMSLPVSSDITVGEFTNHPDSRADITFKTAATSFEDKHVMQLVEQAQARGLTTELTRAADDSIRINVTGAHADVWGLETDLTNARTTLDNVLYRLNPPPPPDIPDIRWPGADGALDAHTQFLIDAREYVSQVEVPEGRPYRQMVHSDAPAVGDIHRPAVLDASYHHFNSSLLSISVPEFIPFEEPYTGADDVLTRSNGMSFHNVHDSFRRLLEESGVRFEDDDAGKIGHDRVSSTYYSEFRIHPDDYERGRAVIDTYIRSDATSAAELLEEIKRGDIIRQQFDIPGSRVVFDQDGRVSIDVPEDFDLSRLEAAGIEGASDLERISPERGLNDVRPGYQRIEIDADNIPDSWSVPIDPASSINVNAGATPEIPKSALGAAMAVLGDHGGSIISSGAAGVSIYGAIEGADEGGHTVAMRGAAAAVDVGMAADDVLRGGALQARHVLKAGGVAIVATTGAEIGVALSNKDGNAAGSAAVIGTSSLVGMGAGAAIGSVVPVVGTGIGAAVGAGVGAVVGVGITATSAVDEAAGRQFNRAIYNGTWFSDGIIESTSQNLEQIQVFRDRIASGETLSQEEIREMQELSENLRDDMMDLRNAELSQAQAFAQTGNEQDGEFLRHNRELQEQIQQTLIAVDNEFETAQNSQLDTILEGTTNADELIARISGNSDVAALVEDAEIVTQVFHNHEKWERRVDEISDVVRDPDTGEFRVDHLTEDERMDRQRDLHNIKEEVEDRMNNLLVRAREGTLRESEYEELVELRDTLDDINDMESGFVETSGPIGDGQDINQRRGITDEARALYEQAGSRQELEELLNDPDNYNALVGVDGSIGQLYRWGNDLNSWESDANRIARQMEGLDDDELLNRYGDLEQVEEELNDRIYNLMVQARDGDLSRSEFNQLERAFELQDRINEIKGDYNQEYLERTQGVATQDFNNAAGSVQPEATVELTRDELRERLGGLDQTQIAGLSPETQSLWELRSSQDAFNAQFESLYISGSLDHVAADIPNIPNVDNAIADPTVIPEQDGPVQSLPTMG